MADLSGVTKEQVEAFYWAREAKRCEESFPYFASTYLHIKSKDIIGFPTLRFNRVQQLMWKVIQRQLIEQGQVRLVVGKPRQLGSSTFFCAFSFWYTSMHRNRDALMVLHDEPTSYEMADKGQTFYDAMPPPLQPALRYRSKDRMLFEANRSGLRANHARNMNVGVSQTVHFLHLSEVSRYANPDEIQGSLFPSLSGATDTTGHDFSACILESTSYYSGGWFKQFAEACALAPENNPACVEPPDPSAPCWRGTNGFEFLFIPWFWHEAYQAPVPKGFTPTEEERDLRRRFPEITLKNLVWYRRKQAEYEHNQWLCQQDFPSMWSSSWQTPGGASQVFPTPLVQTCADLKPGARFWPTADGLTPALDGPLEVWEPPEPDCYYDIGIDLAEGRTATADWSVCEVLRRDTLAQVAEVRLHMNPADREWLDLVYWLACLYNHAQLIPDITGGWGQALLQDLQTRGYGNFWVWRKRDTSTGKLSTRLGYYYTRREKANLVTRARATLQRDRPRIHSQYLYSELLHFLQLAPEEWGAAPGFHDDACNAYMLAILSATDDRVPEEPPEPTPPTPPGEAWEVDDFSDLDDDVRLPGQLHTGPFTI